MEDIKKGGTTTKYYATILVGDEYHSVGETHELAGYEVERTKKEGLRLQVSENGFGDVFYHLYPCSIQVFTYELVLTDITCFTGGDHDKKIGYDKMSTNEYDWKEHWP